MNIITDSQLLDIIDDFRLRFGVKETAFGRSVNGEPGLLPTLRAGRKVSLEMANRIIDFMKDHAAEHGPDWQMPSPDNASQNIGGENIGGEITSGAGVAVLSSPGGEAPGRASVAGLVPLPAADVLRPAQDERAVAAEEAA